MTAGDSPRNGGKLGQSLLVECSGASLDLRQVLRLRNHGHVRAAIRGVAQPAVAAASRVHLHPIVTFGPHVVSHEADTMRRGGRAEEAKASSRDGAGPVRGEDETG